VQLEQSDISAICGGILHAGSSAHITSVNTDTRKLLQGSLFVALKGEQFDGHSYLQQAQQQGAAAALVENVELGISLPQIQVQNCQLALGTLAREWLSRMPCKRIALTGSNGKTTVKNLTHAILSGVAPTCSTEGNFNNEIGLPLSALRVRATDKFAVLELGAGAPGDIAYLAAIALPQIALVNNAAAAHLERLGSIEAVAHEKSAIYRALPADGVAIIPIDDAHSARLIEAAKHVNQISFGLHDNADIRAEAIEVTDGTRFDLIGPFGRAAVHLPLLGMHNVRNALAAAALSYAAGADLPAIVRGLQGANAAKGRLQRVKQPGGWFLIDDSYNANPGSVMAAIDTLSALPGTQILVLGDMAELGQDSAQLHQQVFAYAAARGISKLLCLGPKTAEAARASGFGQSFGTLEDLVSALKPCISMPNAENTHVLVKGSRSSKMERLVQALNVAVLAC